MKRRIAAGSLLVLVLIISPVWAQTPPEPGATEMEPAEAPTCPDLYTLLNFPGDVTIEDLTGSEREDMLHDLITRPEAVQLKMALGEKGFIAHPPGAEVMRVTIKDSTTQTLDEAAQTPVIDVVVVPMRAGARVFLPLVMRGYSPGSTAHLARVGGEESEQAALQASPSELSAYLVAMVAEDGTSLFQAHHTNLDPYLAEVPDPPIVYNDMPYFYITVLQIVQGRILYWNYWWFDSHHHPNWYYASYQYFWTYRYHVDPLWPGLWPGWYHWAYGWYYWRFWYYWSTYFPWAMPPAPFPRSSSTSPSESWKRS